MATEFKLSYTGSQINEKLGKIKDVDASISTTSTNPIQNKVVAENLAKKVSLPSSGNGTAGQFAVSDGVGGINWVSLTNVAEEGA